MKKCISLFLVIAGILTGCAWTNTAKAPVKFYYLCKDIEEKQNAVMDYETREVYGHTDDLNYLIILYLHGPANEDLENPFPASTSLERINLVGNTLYIVLRGVNFSDMTKLDANLSCACIAKTCFELSEIDTVRINAVSERISDDAEIIITRDSLVLTDDTAAYTHPITE